MKEFRTLSELLEALSRGYYIQRKTEESQPLPKPALKQDKDERHFCVSLAGRIIAIHSLYAEVDLLCKEYMIQAEPEIEIRVSDDDIEKERKDKVQPGLFYNNSYLETLVVYRKISEALLNYGTFLMHGSVIAIKQAAYLFTASSGTGKTTHIKKWIANCSEAYVVNGDKPLIRVEENRVLACGTPWSGKEHLGMNIMVPLKAIILMERAEDNQIDEISFGEAFPFLLQQTYQPLDDQMMRKTLSLVYKLRNYVHFYRFRFNNLKEDSFQVAYRVLTGKNA